MARWLACPISARRIIPNSIKAKWHLVEVAQLCCYKGTVWANWDASAPPFLEHLGEFRRFLDLILDGWDGREGQAEASGRRAEVDHSVQLEVSGGEFQR